MFHLVVRRHIKSHQPLQESLRGLVVTEQRVSVHVVSGQHELSRGNYREFFFGQII